MPAGWSSPCIHVSPETRNCALRETSRCAKFRGMDLATYLKTNGLRPGAFAKQLGVAPSTVSGWLHSCERGPSRRLLAEIERLTAGQVTARDFAFGEESTAGTTGARHITASETEAA
jgi:DNA-binding transcriptional regulator YdaS (Cro superfamily)